MISQVRALPLPELVARFVTLAADLGLEPTEKKLTNWRRGWETWLKFCRLRDIEHFPVTDEAARAFALDCKLQGVAPATFATFKAALRLAHAAAGLADPTLHVDLDSRPNVPLKPQSATATAASMSDSPTNPSTARAPVPGASQPPPSTHAGAAPKRAKSPAPPELSFVSTWRFLVHPRQRKWQAFWLHLSRESLVSLSVLATGAVNLAVFEADQYPAYRAGFTYWPDFFWSRRVDIESDIVLASGKWAFLVESSRVMSRGRIDLWKRRAVTDDYL